jgi:hypothetical protein
VVSSSEQGVGNQPITVEIKRRDRLAAHKTRRICMQDTQECACPQPFNKQWNVQRVPLRGSACLLEWAAFPDLWLHREAIQADAWCAGFLTASRASLQVRPKCVTASNLRPETQNLELRALAGCSSSRRNTPRRQLSLVPKVPSLRQTVSCQTK